MTARELSAREAYSRIIWTQICIVILRWKQMGSFICFRSAGLCDVAAGLAILRRGRGLGVAILVAPKRDHVERGGKIE